MRTKLLTDLVHFLEKRADCDLFLDMTFQNALLSSLILKMFLTFLFLLQAA